MSTLLAATMLVSSVLPNLVADSSDVAGDAKKVTKIIADDSSYDIPVGTTVDFSDKIKVFESETKLVLDKQHIRYELVGASGDYGSFKINGSKVTALSADETSTLTIYDNYNKSNKARVTVNINSVEGSENGVAETFTFIGSKTNLPFDNGTVGMAED